MERKTHFGTTLHEVMKENGLTMEEVGKSSDTARGQLSKWKAGRWQVIPEDRLTDVLDVVCKTADQRRRCIMAYVVDMVPANDRPMLYNTPPKPEVGIAAVNAEMNVAFKNIAVAVKKNAEFAKMFRSMAGFAKSIAKE